MPGLPTNDPKPYSEEAAQSAFERILMQTVRQGPTLQGQPLPATNAKITINNNITSVQKERVVSLLADLMLAGALGLLPQGNVAQADDFTVLPVHLSSLTPQRCSCPGSECYEWFSR